MNRWTVVLFLALASCAPEPAAELSSTLWLGSPSTPSCAGYCGGVGYPAVGTTPCSCAPDCVVDGTCCDDNAVECPLPDNSCTGRCGDVAPSGCSCNPGVPGSCSDAVALCSEPGRAFTESVSLLPGAIATDGDSYVIGGMFEGDNEFADTELNGTPEGIAQDVVIAKLTAGHQLSWSFVIGGTEQQWLHDLAIDGQGFVYAVGSFRGTADFDGKMRTSAGQTDAFLLCLTPAGSFAWVRTWGTAGYDNALHVVAGDRRWPIVSTTFAGAIDIGAGLMSGPAHAVVAFDEGGNTLWSRPFDTSTPRPPSLAISTVFEELLVGAMFVGTVDVGGGAVTSVGGSDVLVARYDHWGTPIVPTFSFGGTGDETVSGIAGDDWSNVYVTGGFDQVFNVDDHVAAPHDESAEMYLASLLYTGESRWLRTFPGAKVDFPATGIDPNPERSVGTDPAGNVWVSTDFESHVELDMGVTLSGSDFDTALASFTTDGRLRTYAQYGGSNGQFSRDLDVDVRGRGWLLGWTFGDLEWPGGVVSIPQPTTFVHRHPD